MLYQSQMMIMVSQSQQVMNTQHFQMKMMMNQLIDPFQMMMNQSQSQRRMKNNRDRGYRMWPPAQSDQIMLKNQNTKLRNNRNWKVKKRNNNNRNDSSISINNRSNLANVGGADRLKPRRYISKKKFNHGGFAPRNTTSFLIRAKKAGGITSLVSPCPVTPAVLPTPVFSPSREVLVDMAKEEWGVDGYGSMKGLIRLRSPGNDENGGSSESSESNDSDVEEHLEVERRLDHDLSRFEMIYPNNSGFESSDHMISSYVLENRVDDQDAHIGQLEEENLLLKDRLFLMEMEFSNLRTRLQSLEMQRQGARGLIIEVVENDYENESGRSIEGCN